MNWIILYIIAFLLIIAVLGFGVLLNSQARVCYEAHKSETNSKGMTSKEFANKLFEHNKLRNIALTSLKAKKTNYYSAKYNVIKLAPEVASSSFLFDLAICAKCTNKATKQQYNYISSALKFIFDSLLKFIYTAFIPVVLISAILNISFNLEKVSFLITLISIICLTLAFITHLIMHFFEQSSVKKITQNLKNTKLLEENELKTLEIFLLALNKFEFFTQTRLTIRLFTFMSPGTIFDKSQE